MTSINENTDVIDTENKVKENDEYSYLKTSGNSTEAFKIEVRNLPKYYGVNEFRKLLTAKLNLRPGKVKPPHVGSKWMYICFKNEEDRNDAIEKLKGYTWKKSVLHAEKANPSPDPLVMKRKLEAANEKNARPKVEDTRSQQEKIKSSTTPLCNIPYDEQLSQKQVEMKKILMKFSNELWKIYPDIRSYIQKCRKKENGLMCNFYGVKPSPVTEGYRNKCEFTVGIDEETGLKTVGFRIGTYADGSTGVAPISELRHICDEMKQAVSVFQDFVRSSSLKEYSPLDHSGYWKQLMSRISTKNKQQMLVIGIHPQDMTLEELSNLKKQLVDHFMKEKSEKDNIVSLYLQLLSNNRDNRKPDIQHMWGETHIYDEILELTFRISPQAFFQTNTLAANVLYQTAIDLSEPQSNTSVLDICCGTGTIGLCFAKKCGEILGLEIIPEAIADARVNASSNEIKNAHFFVGRAEDIISQVAARAVNENIIAVVDPPRAGLQLKAILQLRRTAQIKKIVYISCDPSRITKNFLDLSRAPSKTVHGDPFILTKAVAVDMFPHTNHTELVLLFERMTEKELISPESSDDISAEKE